MGRSRRSSPASPRRAPSTPKRAAPAPARTASAPPPATQGRSEGMMSGLMGTVAQGMAFGTGSAIAHRAVGAVANSFGGSDSPNEVAASATHENGAQHLQPPQPSCSKENKEFLECINSNAHDVGACQMYLDNFKQCQYQSSYM